MVTKSAGKASGLVVRAAKLDEVREDKGRWVIVDLGFAAQRKTTAVLDVGSGTGCAPGTFAEACEKVIEVLVAEARKDKPQPVLLMLEAPLSAVYDSNGNPAPRGDFESKLVDGRHSARFWYLGLGCAVAMAAVELVGRVKKRCRRLPVQVLLVEGFVSFKPPKAKHKGNPHCLDACSLWAAVKRASKDPIDVAVEARKLAESRNSEVQPPRSIFAAFGFDPGVPPIVQADKSRS